jgi:hypothetical protein
MSDIEDIVRERMRQADEKEARMTSRLVEMFLDDAEEFVVITSEEKQ